MRRTRGGPSIRRFLRYYLLVLLAEEPRSKREMVREIRERSEGNRPYRSTGVLWPASEEMDRVLDGLADKGLVTPPARGDRWRIAQEGRRALQAHPEPEEDSNAKERAAAKLMELLGPGSPDVQVLDVGTGQGYLALKLAERGFRVLGIDSGCFDYSADSIEKAREEAADRGGQAQFRQADVRELDLPDSSFDYVVSSQAVHCMEDQRGCVAAAHCLLRPGGKFVCMDYLVGVRGFHRHGFHCFLALSREEWVDLLLEQGFINIRMYETDDFLVVEAQKP